MVRTQVQLSQEQARQLRQLAALKNTSLAELIREGVEAVLRSHHSVGMDDRRQRAIAAAGAFRFGVNDASDRHDDYFVEAAETHGRKT